MRYNQISEAEHRERMRLYSMGLSDKEIAKQICVVPMAVSYWRHKNGLEANMHRGLISMQAYEFLREMAGKNELCKEILQAVKPRMEDL